MKATDIQVFIVGNPPPSFGGRYFIRGLTQGAIK